MTDIDLTEAVEAAAQAVYDGGRLPQACDFDALTDFQRHAYRTVVTPIVAACAPILRAQAFEESAALLRTLRDRLEAAQDRSFNAGIERLTETLRARAAEIRGHE